MFSLLNFAEGLVSDWFVTSLPIYRDIILCLIAVCAIGIIVCVLMQNTVTSGASAITGIVDSYYSQNKGNTKEGRVKKMTAIFSIVIVVLIVLYFVPSFFYGG